MRNFVHLHTHTDYSMLDGLGKPSDYAQRAADLKMPAMAITDHGNMSGAYEFYVACRKQNVRPIIGFEAYFVPNADTIRDEKSGERFHVVILARNADGFRTLCELQGEAHRRFYYKPVIDRAVCEALAYEEAENLTLLTGCAGSILSKKALGEMKGSARQELSWWRETFPHTYVELQHHDTDFDRTLNKRLLKLARDYKLPWVVTNDPHYVMDDDEECHDALLAVQTASQIDDPDRFAFHGTGYHLRTEKEMMRAFKRYGEKVWKPGIRSTMEIARDSDIRIPEWDKTSWHIPKYHRTPKDTTSYDLLKKYAIRGLKKRGLDDDERYVERLKYELSQIKSIEGFADFLLITREIIQWANKQGIRVGPGRGSTAGCLVAYCIGLHKIDSIRYKLLFERFLNPARPKMPDIDTDFSQARRPEVIDHIIDEYGVDYVLPVAAFQTMKVRGSFRKLATAFGMPFADLKKFTDQMASAWGTEDSDDEDEEDHIRIEHLPTDLVQAYPEVISLVEQMIGTKSAISRHPAGVLIFDPEDPIRKLVPEMWSVSSKRMVAQYDLKSAEKMGLMKQDILGLRTLDTIDECLKLIEEQTGELLDPDEWVPDEEDGDKEVYKMMSEGRNAGVFQIEGGTMANGIIKIKPRRFEDIVACTSIYRLGPMLTGAPDRYIANKKARKVRVLHEKLRPILEDTWGEMAYQEQLMQIASDVAGFDQGGVADLLAAVRFKDEKMMAPLHADFVKGCKTVSGIKSETAEMIWTTLEKQAAYLFNRSHAAAYSMMTYQTARLKCWWPLQFLTALMRTVEPKKDNIPKRQTFLAEAVDRGYRILPPDVNLSEAKFTCGEDDEGPWMRFGLWDIKGIGETTAERVLKAREEAGGEFGSVAEAQKLIPAGLFAKLDVAGALADLGGQPRDFHELEEILGWQFEDRMAPLRQKYAKKVRLPGRGSGRVRLIGEIIEIVRKKTKSNKPYMTWRIRWTPSEVFTVTLWEDADSLWDTTKGSIVVVEGKWNPEFRNVSVGDHEQVRVLRYAKTKKKEAA